MIEVKNLTKKYGRIFALRDVSFTVESGEVVGFLGPNGAGKTTTMNIVTGYISSTSGSVAIDGCDILEHPSQAKSRIGYLPEQPPLYLDMTVNEYLNFLYDLKGCLLPREKHLAEICELTGIDKVRTRLIGNLSKGYRQRVGIAQALVCNPPVLILDEPTIGLDPSQIIEIRSLIRKLGVKHTVILSSHILSEVQAICDRIIVLDRGRIVADSKTEQLSKTLGASALLVTTTTEEKAVRALLGTIPSVTDIKVKSRSGKEIEYSVSHKPQSDIRLDVSDIFAKNNVPILGMRTAQMSLEDIFISLTANE